MSFVNKKWTEPINYNFKLKLVTYYTTVLEKYTFTLLRFTLIFFSFFILSYASKIQGVNMSVCISSKIYMYA